MTIARRELLLRSAIFSGAAAALVSVTNTFSNPVPTRASDNPAFQAWGARVFPNVRAYASLVVPAGKYLVMNDITGFHNGTTAIDLEVVVQSNGVGSAKRIPFDNTSTNGLRFLRVGPSFIVADPGSTVYFFIDDADYNDSAGINIDVHGYYVAAN